MKSSVGTSVTPTSFTFFSSFLSSVRCSKSLRFRRGSCGMYPALGYSATYMLCTHNSPFSKRQYDSVMLALPPRMDLISEPDSTNPAVKSSVRKYV